MRALTFLNHATYFPLIAHCRGPAVRMKSSCSSPRGPRLPFVFSVACFVPPTTPCTPVLLLHPSTQPVLLPASLRGSTIAIANRGWEYHLCQAPFPRTQSWHPTSVRTATPSLAPPPLVGFTNPSLCPHARTTPALLHGWFCHGLRHCTQLPTLGGGETIERGHDGLPLHTSRRLPWWWGLVPVPRTHHHHRRCSDNGPVCLARAVARHCLRGVVRCRGRRSGHVASGTRHHQSPLHGFHHASNVLVVVPNPRPQTPCVATGHGNDGVPRNSFCSHPVSCTTGIDNVGARTRHRSDPNLHGRVDGKGIGFGMFDVHGDQSNLSHPQCHCCVPTGPRGRFSNSGPTIVASGRVQRIMERLGGKNNEFGRYIYRCPHCDGVVETQEEHGLNIEPKVER